MKRKDNILILTPHLNNIGGTELETLITAKIFLKNGIASNIDIFSPMMPSYFIKNLFNEDRIQFKYYPNFFHNRYFLKCDSVIKKMFKSIPRNFNLLQYFYWLIKKPFTKCNFVYVMCSTNQVYHYPIIANYSLNKVIIKHTAVGEYNNWNMLFEKLLKKCKVILVTSKKQKYDLVNKYKLQNVDFIDVFIENENQLNQIEINRDETFTFGMLCRISEEKRIEDGIKMVKKLYDLDYNVKLKINGIPKNDDYLNYLINLIQELKAEVYITLESTIVSPSKVTEFYKNINAFLITSNTEGGPNTGLECMAAGIPILSYDVGAMKERLEPFKKLFIADDLDSLLVNAEYLINFTEDEYNKLSVSIKKHYMEVYNNDIKFEKINSFFAN
ncbi:MAG: glycosyltransferase [Flavobacteriaceae bacterium]|nr:glycosyltransferase [Flavobacteriaceae bacterium]